MHKPIYPSPICGLPETEAHVIFAPGKPEHLIRSLLMRHWIGGGLLALLLGCVTTPPRKTNEELFEIYLEHMARMQDSLDELEYVKTDNMARAELAKIKKNAAIARDNRPRDLGGNLERYFQEFLKTVDALEKASWNETRFRELDNACSRCHERPQ